MKCPKCDFDNRTGASFCLECGRKLEIGCPHCGKHLPPGAKFCDSCGQNLNQSFSPTHQELSFEKKLEKIQRYLPKGLSEKILSQRDRIEGERKQVTVMFCDLEGFTPLVEKIGADEAYTVMDQVYELLIQAVHDYEGTVNEMTGDGIMALFGAPIALEDASQRAIHSALRVQRDMARCNDRLKREGKALPPLKMRIGIHSGPVVVGTLGNDLRVEFKAVGDTVNLAKRMEQLADPGATYITEDTFKLTEGLFRFEALGEKQIKGKKEPINAYRVITSSSRRTRFDVNAERGLTPLVGRNRELEILLDGFETVKSGRGQAFSIVAEAGAGKSRLLYEFHKAVTNEEVTIMEGKCLSYARNVAYHPVIDILKANFKLDEGDTERQVKQKVTAGLNDIGVEPISTLPYLLDLLSVKESGIDELDISPDLKKERVIASLLRIVLKGSDQRPLIMIFEDLHWVDVTTETLLNDILESIPGSRVLLLFSYRPEYVHTWGGKSYHNQLNLNRLSNRESLSMLAHMMGSQEIEDELKEMVLNETEGIPFFIEEFVKSLKNLKLIEKREKYSLVKDDQSMIVPSTIQDMIMSRVDALPDSAKEVLQTGSVIEREFSLKLIKEVMDMPEPALLSNLSRLKDSELLYERGVYPDSILIFKHALAREVVVDSLLNDRKRLLHDRIGQGIEKIHRNKIDAYLEILAEHYTAAENFEKGELYLKLAMRKSEKAASLDGAITFAEKRVLFLEKQPESESSRKKIIDARSNLCNYYNQFNRHLEAKKTIEPVMGWLKTSGNQKRLAQAYVTLGTYYWISEEDIDKSKAYLEEALAISEQVADIASMFFSYYWLAVLLALSCDFQGAIDLFEKCIDINRSRKVRWGESSVISHMSLACLCNKGDVDLAYRTGHESLKLAESSGDSYSKALTYTSLAHSSHFKGYFDEAISHAVQAVSFCRKIGLNLWETFAQGYLGEIYYDTGSFQKSIEHYNYAIHYFEKTKYVPSWATYHRLGRKKGEQKIKGIDIDLKSLIEDSQGVKLHFYQSCCARYLGDLLLESSQSYLDQAVDWIEKSIELGRQNGVRWDLARAHALYADVFKQQQNIPKAREQMNNAIEIMTGCGADGWVERYENELAELG
ncbi:AAA family ATPase [bacterium]|nr:AAA family ATPase [bacterium]